ncbi:MAG TPA: lipopolysaccharide kinase InaA family protein [Gemmataceae bacterium]|nr:lipopolysaccharide kinase InaA family protein [Gemmataceae bacterium]
MDAISEFVVLERGGVRWQMRPGLEHLFGPNGLRLDEWLAAGQTRVVKHGPHRTVYHVVLSGLDFYLKHNRLADYRAKLRELVRPSKARIEYEHARVVAARQVPTFEPLAFGEPCRSLAARDSFLITRALPETRPLHSFLETTLPQWPLLRQTRLRQRLAVALGRLLARMHDAGIAHHDLHPGNLLLRLDAEDRPELFLIDLHAVRIGSPLSWHARRANLILLNRWFSLRSERTDRLRFWRVYQSSPSLKRKRRADQQSLAYASDPDAIADLESRTLVSNLRMWRKLDRRCFGGNRHFRRVCADGVAGHAAADLSDEVLAPLLANPDAPFERPDKIVLKRSPSSAVLEFDLPGPNGPRRVIYKRFAVTRWSDPWAALFRPPPALRSYVLGHGLLLRCLPTPRPLAVWHRYRHGLAHEGYLLTEKVADALELRSFVDGLTSLPAAECRKRLRRLIDQTAHLLATLHQRRLSHRDLKAANLLVGGVSMLSSDGDVSLSFIDLVGVRRLRKLRRSRRVQNLARLNTSFLGHPVLTRSDRLRFLRVYLRWGLRGRIGWKRWWKQIAEATANKIQRNLHKGRPLG